MGPGLQTQSQGLNWEWAGQKPAANQDTVNLQLRKILFGS